MADLEKEQVRGNDAAFILDHAIFKEAWDAAKQSLEAQRLRSALRDTDLHTRLVIAEQILNTLHKYIENIMQTGNMAQQQLSLREQRFRFLRK